MSVIGRAVPFIAYSTPPSFVASAKSTSTVVNKPTGTVAGDLIVLLCSSDVTGTATPPTGFTNLVGGSGLLQGCYKIAGGSEPSTYTYFIGGSTFRGTGAATFRGVSGIGVTGSRTTTSSSNVNISGVTVPVANSILLAFTGSSGAVQFTAPSGMSTAVSSATLNPPVALFYEAIGSGASSNRNSAASGSANLEGFLISLSP